MFKIATLIMLMTTYAIAMTGNGATYTINTTDSPTGTYTYASGTTYNAMIMTEETVVKQAAFGSTHGLRFGMLASQLGTVPVYVPPPPPPPSPSTPGGGDPVASYRGIRGMDGKGVIFGCGSVDIHMNISKSIFNLITYMLPLLLILFMRINIKARRSKIHAKK